MGLFDKVFRPDKNREQEQVLKDANSFFKTFTTYRPVFRSWQGSIYESELIRSAINARARHISKLKVEINGEAKPKLTRRMLQGPNEWQNWPQFLARTSTILDIHNSAFIVPVRDNDMYITGYYTVLPHQCEIVDYKGEPWVRYRFTYGDIGAARASECSILTQFQYKSDFFGESNNALKPTLKLLDLNEQGIEEAIKNGATFRFWAQMGNFAKSADIRNEEERFNREHFQAENGGMLLFPNTYANIHQYNQAPYTVDQAQLEQIRTSVYNYFGVNEDILQNKAYGDAWSAFYEGFVEVFAVQFSEAMTRAMFTETERSYGNRLMLTSNRLQYLSNADKLQVAAQLTDRGIFSINEAREVFNLPPVEGGDIRTIRGEYKNADEIGGENGNE